MTVSSAGRGRTRGIGKGRRVLAAAVGTGTVVAFTVLATTAGTAHAQPLPTGCTQSGQTVTCSYTYTGGEQTFTVPSGVTTLDVTAVGAAGGDADAAFTGAPHSGGPGASVEDTAVPVGAYQGQALTVVVGGVGGAGTRTNGGAGGSPGGGGSGGDYPNGNQDAQSDGAGGGGYSALLSPSGTSLVVAAGGGGGSTASNGGAGDIGNGGGAGGSYNGLGGGGGTSTTGGAGGAGRFGGGNGSAGALLAGGQGGASDGTYASGGGGGGGYYGGGGGGGGSYSGGGGGGSSYGITGLTNEAHAAGPASVTISYTVQPLRVTTTSLPAAVGGQGYSAALDASGGVMPYSWKVTSGSLPPGLALSSAGVISGVPDVAGTYEFTVTVSDAESPAMTASAALSIAVSGPVITSLSPDHGPAYGDTPVRIFGSGLSCPAGERGCKVSVSFGAKPAVVILASPSLLEVVSPAGSGTVTVTVTVGGVSSQATTVSQFTYAGFPLL